MVFGFFPLLPPSPFLLFPYRHYLPSSLCRSFPWLLGFSSLLCVCQGLATMWDAPRQEVSYPSHDDTGLLLWCPLPP